MKNSDINLATLSHLFTDEDAAREFLESKRWPDGAVCPHCGEMGAYKLTPKPGSKKPVRPGVWKCRGCRKQFTVKVGTIFEDSHIGISKWLMIIHLMTSSKKGVSAHQVHRQVGITYKSAWFACHRIREAMRKEPMVSLLSGNVEADETYVGGKPRYRQKKEWGKKLPIGRGTKKTPVFALVERDGSMMAKPLERVTRDNIRKAIRDHVHPTAIVHTDDYPLYRFLGKEYAGHHVVKHSAGEYVRGSAYTNTVESYSALLKRAHYGTHHHYAKKHLHRYVDEQSFKWDHRKVTDGERMVRAIEGAEGKRLTYKPLKGNA